MKRMLSDNKKPFRKVRKEGKRNLQSNWWQKMWVWHSKMLEMPKILRIFVWKYDGYYYESENEEPPHHSEFRQIKYLQQTLNSMNGFILSLLMSYVGSRFKLLRMHWCRSTKPFITNLKLVIKKHVCRLYDSFPGANYSSNNFMLSGMSKYICLYNFNKISFEFLHMIFLKCMSNLNAFVNIIWPNKCIWLYGIDWILKKCCIGYMPYFTCGNYVYFNYNDEIPEKHHKQFIMK